MPHRLIYNRGFTLVELLTTIAIVGVLTAILLPVIANVKEAAHNTKCASNLRQIGNASLNYIQENNSALPQLDYQYINVLFPYIYPEKAEDIPKIVGGQPFPEGLINTVFYCPSMDTTVVNSRSYAINNRIAELDFIETSNGETEANKWNLPVTLIEDPSKTAFFSDTYTTSNMSQTMWSSQAKALDRHGHLNVVFLDGHVEAVQPDEPRVQDKDSEFWIGKRKQHTN
ncbi:type II secretion system protein [Rubellicoccus peritrichatus]|uniref:Type II secretion system protein n=1 Tax=Rubellicoccus peritrichatus TaxID=3080537 RepID=A0AAQ3LE42_9BACT|nr:type II secretion system protein [Puniceicoccus sp. CR14]WOO43707.1 type II secretion system protein [Puniceicoccus sp. CR14]